MMGLIELIVWIALIGLAVWVVHRFLPIDPIFKTIVLVVGVVVAIVLVLYAFGLLPRGDIPVPKLR